MAWNVIATKHIAIAAMLFFVALYLLCLMANSVFLSLLCLQSEKYQPLPLRLVCGFYLLSTALFFLTLASPLGIEGNSLSLAALVLVSYFFMSKRMNSARFSLSSHTPELWCLFIGLIAATFWCWDALDPIAGDANMTVFQFWQDSFFHARQISIFAMAKGIATISDISMAGAPPHIYHFASYSIPAAFSAITSTPAYLVFASFYVPFGLVLTILAAYTLLITPFGQWPALAGCAALALLPDAFQQGFDNKWLSYHWLQQIGPAGFYGVALMALAWSFMFESCTKGKPSKLLIAYFFALLVLLYKAQMFVANSYLIFIYPCIFMAGVKATWRIAGLLALSFVYFFTVHISQHYNNIPLLELNWNSFESYMTTLLASFKPGAVGEFFLTKLTAQPAFNVYNLLWAMLMLSLCTFGLFLVLLMPLTSKLLQKLPPYITAFPLLVIIVYLIMSTGLEYDSRKLGMPEELLHRPFVWAYFVVCSWSVAAAAYVLFDWLQEFRPQGLPSRYVLWPLLALLFLPLLLSHKIQTLPGDENLSNFPRIPTCLVKSAEYIRTHSLETDVVQDSSQGQKNEIKDYSAIVLTSLAERQAYAINTDGMRPAAGLDARLQGLEHFKQLTTIEAIYAFANSHKIDWYVLLPWDSLAWPAKLLHTQTFQCGGYRVYQFSAKRDGLIGQG